MTDNYSNKTLSEEEIAATIQSAVVTPSDPSIERLTVIAKKKRRTARATRAYIPLTPQRVSSAACHAMTHADPPLTEEHMQVLVAFLLYRDAVASGYAKNISDTRTDKDGKTHRVPRTDLACKLKEMSEHKVSLEVPWLASRVADMYRRSGRWREWQDPEKLQQHVVQLLQDLSDQTHRVEVLDSNGRKVIMKRFRFLDIAEGETENGKVLFWTVRTALALDLLRAKRFTIINPETFFAGNKVKYQTALALIQGSMTPKMVWEAKQVSPTPFALPIKEIVPGYESMTRKQRQRARDAVERAAVAINDADASEEKSDVSLSEISVDRAAETVIFTPKKEAEK